MTALIYILNPKSVMIGMDTLSLRMDKLPHGYVTKIFPLPHLKSVICGTGAADLTVDWYSIIQKFVIGRDITTLNETAKQKLSELFNNYEFKYKTTASIYHFGYNLKTRKFEGSRFRSDNS